MFIDVWISDCLKGCQCTICFLFLTYAHYIEYLLMSAEPNLYVSFRIRVELT